MHTVETYPAAPVFSEAGQSHDWFEPLPGERMRVRIGSDATSGRLTLIENVVAPGAAAPCHLHQDADELFIVLEGRFCVTAGSSQYEAGPGAAMFVPRGAAHAFVNMGSGAARLLSVFTPGGMEAMFREAAMSSLDAIPALAARHRTLLLAAGVPD